MRQYLELGPGPENKGSSMKGDDLVQIEEVIDKAQRLLLEGKPEMSLAVLDNLGPEGLKYATVRNKKGVCLVSLNKMAEAEVEFRAAIAIDREYSPAYTNLGNIFKERGDNQRAIELYERAIQADPTYPNAHHNLGNTLNKDRNTAFYGKRGHQEGQAQDAFLEVLLGNSRICNWGSLYPNYQAEVNTMRRSCLCLTL
jgi:tetratricopeptide (TPR) repeat protein